MSKPLKQGDKFPEGVQFECVPLLVSDNHPITLTYISNRWAPITDPDPTACGIPQVYDASKEFAGKKVVLVSVPGAFTPGCQALHIPPYIQSLDKLQSKGVDLVVVIASNDAWVMAAWGKVNGVKADSKILCKHRIPKTDHFVREIDIFVT